MIFDTSVWIDFLRGKKTGLADLLQHRILEDEKVFICPPIYQEILQGIKTENELVEIKQLLTSLDFLSLDPYFVAEGAAKIFRDIQRKGVTIRKPNDCIIAFYAIHFNLKLVHSDSDFDKIAKHTSLKIYKK
ncbi:MAG TPA: VapC toxin family PIN domain ribonuclease [Cytophagales bacterium]|jgi:predicted nucleic acid-binding protein|nr:VapC toxin family PIN domain ribonuclease [Cytophagales bacterium]